MKREAVLLLCAWALWMEQPVGSNRWRFSPSEIVAFETRQQCVETAKYYNEANRVGGKRPTELFRCLPDTVDPRGPKAR
jgi:hypothetical protein